MKILKNKMFIALILCLSVLVGAVYFIVPTQQVSANDDYDLTVQKVNRTSGGNEEVLQTLFNSENTNSSNSNVAMLLNDARTPQQKDNDYGQFIKVSFKPVENIKLQFLEVNAFLNGIAINTLESIDDNPTEDEDSHEYNEYFDLHNTRLLQTDTLLTPEEAQGMYTFVFGYMSQSADGTTSIKNTVSINFYILNQTSYINKNNIVEPKVANTENITRTQVATIKPAGNEQTYANMYSYFNYNNIGTKDYFNAANKFDKIYYPTITFDPTRYYANYSKILYGETETATTTYNPANNTVVITKTINGVSTNEVYQINENKHGYYVEIPLYNIGNYHITFDYVVKQYNTTNYEKLNTRHLNTEGLIDKNNITQIVSENWERMGDIELSIYGYQLYHTVYKSPNGAGESELSDHAKLFADVSNANVNVNAIAGAEINSDKEAFEVDNFTSTLSNFSTVISTNQAPLSFEYNGSILTTGVNNVNTKSYYNLYTDSSKSTIAKVDGIEQKNIQIDSNSRFTENGYYEVFVSYVYNGYKYYNNTSKKVLDGNTKLKVQVFAFTVENINPVLSLTTADGKEFDANGFTNQDVTIKWQVNNMFNVLPEISISTQPFGDNQLTTDVTNKYQTQIDAGSVTLTENNLYTITIKYGPCTYNVDTSKYDYSSQVSYMFTIDKEAIEDIKILQVDSSATKQGWFVLGDELTQQSTNNNFTVIFGKQNSQNVNLKNGKKASGANITATYIQILMDDNAEALKYFESNQKTYVTNENVFNTINYDLNYTQITKLLNTDEIESNDPSSVFIDSKQTDSVLTENAIYIFKFTDDAGNITTKLIILDKTSPTLLKKIDGEDYTTLKGTTNIVNTDTTVLWGDYKAIKFDNNLVNSIQESSRSEEFAEIFNSAEFIVSTKGLNDINEYYYCTPINNAEIQVKHEDKITNQTVISNKQLFTAMPNENNIFSGAGIYNFTITDINGNQNETTYLEMNFDKSLLMVHIEGDAKDNVQIISNESTFTSEALTNQNKEVQRLFPDATTNRRYIFADWLENKGTEYEIGSIICEFYPLTFEGDSSTNENYPYSQIATQTFDLTANKTYGVINKESRVLSVKINVIQDDRYGDNATMPGKYVITRTYKNPIPESTDPTSDKTSRTYNFYVDRQNIISYFNNNILVGSDISINMQNGQKSFSGNQFLQEFIYDYVLQTNKLPVNVFVPAYKYLNNVAVASENNFALTLNYIVYNEYGKQIYTSAEPTSNNNLNRFTLSGKYQVVIYDNTHGEIGSSYKEGTNKVQFNFSINNTAPQVSIINKDNIIVTDDAFNTNKVKIGWIHDADGYMANIDQQNLTIKRLLPSGASQVIYKLVNGSIQTGSAYGNIITKADDKASWQYEIDLSKFAITTDCKLEITVQYEGSELDYGDYFKTTQTIYFDYSAPEYNYHNLLSQDTYLSNEQKASFGDYNSSVNFENYAFMVDENFKVNYAPADNFWKTDGSHNINDTISAWYRRYDKYSNENDPLTMQSIVPSDARYSDLSQAPQRLRFNENLTDSNGQLYYNEIGNRSLPLYQIVNGTPGYYEIIERDIAGNYRVYTVVIYPSASLSYMAFDYNTYLSAMWNESETGYYYNINSESLTIDNINLVLQNTKVGNNWFNVTLTSNKDDVTTTLNLSTAPYKIDGLLDMEELINQINDFVYYDTSIANSGYSYGIILNCSNGKSYTINYKTPGGEPTIEFTGSQTNLTVSFVQDPASNIYLTEFNVYEAVNGQVDYNDNLQQDSNNKQIEVTPQMPNAGEDAITVSYTFRNTSGTGRNLVFVYKDNFGVQYKTFKIIGITDIDYEDMINISGNYDRFVKTDADGKMYYEYYTNEITKLNYQSAIYSVSSFKVYNHSEEAEVEIDFTQLESLILTNGTTLTSLYDQRLANTHISYEIVLIDTLDNTYKFVIHYYSQLADIYFVDSSNNLHDMDNEIVVSRALFLTYDKNQYQYETFVTITKSYTDEYGQYFEETFDGENGLILTEGANYQITKYNKFGDSYAWNFTIRKSSATHFYSVLVSPDGINLQEISPSTVRYNYNNSYIEQYFTIYDAVVEVSSVDNLVCEEVGENDYGNGSITKIYYIHTDDLSNITYEKYIAVTKISYSRNFLLDQFTINETPIINQKMLTVTTETVTIQMPAYNQAPGNQVQVQIYYNSQYIGYLQDYVLSADGSTMTFELNNCGTYMLYVSDLAGNNQWFNDANYFTLYVLNNIVYKLNAKYGINNSIFNSNVSLSFDETQTLFTRQTVSGSNYKTYIAINATLNGKSYTPTRSGENYIFSGFGTFHVRLSGIINNDTENPIITEVRFSIINQNEAKVAHEYIGLNGYEVTNIVKNGIDITDDIREQLNRLTINNFALSGGLNGVGGNGHYQITVKVNYDSIIPTQYFTYNVWINNDTEALILCNLQRGDSTTGNIEIKLNLYQIYSKIGECVVKVNGDQFITVDANSAAENKISTYQFTTNQRYNITLETNSGNTLLSFVVTKVEPLNTIAIIVIVVASAVFIGLTVTFILLRKRMKIR